MSRHRLKFGGLHAPIAALFFCVIISGLSKLALASPPPSALSTGSDAPSPPPATVQRAGGLLVDAPSTVLLRTLAEPQYRTDDITPGRRKEAERQAKFNEEMHRNTDCENGALQGKSCRVSWWRVLSESAMFLSSQHGGNLLMDSDTRYNLTHGSFWGDYIYCVDHFRWSRWKDDDPFGVDYIGHPMMGAMTSSIYEQNDPKQRALTYENTQRYWMGRLRAMAFSAAYSAQWKVGPLSEASIGNTGIGYYVRHRDGVYTNETGMQDFFMTPIGGLAWNVGEDAIDRFVFSHVRHAHPRNKPLRIIASFMTPLKSGANILRFRAMYYRDSDVASVTAQSR